MSATRRLIGLVAGSLAWAQLSPAQVTWQAMCEPGSGGAITSISVSPHDEKRLLVGGDMLGAGLSVDGGDSWQWVMGLKGWEIADSTWHANDASIVWLGTMSGPYVSTDGGATWTEKRKGMPPINGGAYSVPIEKVLFDPDQPGRLLAFGGSSRRWNLTGASYTGVVWESTDSGENWQKLTVIAADGSDASKERGPNIVAVSYLGTSSERLMLLAEPGGVYVSDDDGRTWKNANGDLPKGFAIGRLAAHPTDSDVAYISVPWLKNDEGKEQPGGIYKTSDGGKTWEARNAGLTQVVTSAGNRNLISNYSGLAISRSNPNVLYTCDGSWAQGIIYKSTDGGETWQANCTRGQLGQKDNEFVGKVANIETATFAGLSMGFMTISPTNENHVYAINSEYIARTHDGGKTWDDATAYRPDAEKPDHWRGRGYSGWCSNEVVFNPKDATDSLLLAMDAGKGWRSRDGMKSWKYVGHKPWAWGSGNAAVYSGDVIYMTTGQFGDNLGVHKVMPDDTQVIFAGAKHGVPEMHQEGPIQGIYALPEDSSKVWVVWGGKLYGSTDGGENWSALTENLGLVWLAGDPTNPARFYATGKAGVYVCEDGRTLQSIGGPRPATRGKMHVDARGRIYVALWRSASGGLWRYDGANWTRLLDDSFIFDVSSDHTDPTRIALVTSDDPYHDYSSASGIWVSADDGASWAQANTGMPMLRLQCIEFNPHNPEQLAAGAYGSGFFLGTWEKSFRPVGFKRYQATAADRAFALSETPKAPAPSAPAAAPVAQPREAGQVVIRDFANATFDYVYGETWKLGQTLSAVTQNGQRMLQIDATEHGGAGIVLNGRNLTPSGQTHLYLRGKRLPGHGGGPLNVNIHAGGKSIGVSIPTSKFSAEEITTVSVPLPAGDYSKVEQVQVQGANFSASAQPVKLLIASIGTTGGTVDSKSDTPAGPRSGAPAADKPYVPAWGYW